VRASPHAYLPGVFLRTHPRWQTRLSSRTCCRSLCGRVVVRLRGPAVGRS